jgi:hypothetical protein
MGTRQRIIGMTRLGAVLVLAAGVGVVGPIGASAAAEVPPAPLGSVGDTAASLVPAPLPADPTQPVTQVVGTLKGALKGAGGTGSGSGSQPSTKTDPRPASSSSPPAANTSASRAGAAPAADDDTVVAADASVRDLLGACVRLTRSGVPARTTVVVLDQNLIDQLTAVGLPLDRLLVPCPAATAIGTRVGTGGTTRAAATTEDPAEAGTLGPLAFTGTNLPGTLLLAAGLLALGIAFLRKAHALVEVRDVHTEDV